MGSHADSEEQLGEKAPAGVPALEVDKKGLPGRYGQSGPPETAEWEEETDVDLLEYDMDVTPTPGVGGEPEVGGTKTSADTSRMG